MAQQMTHMQYHDNMEAALKYIRNHLMEPIDTVALAREAGFSPFHFHRIFTAMFGEAPAQYVNRLRLENAANMLCSMPKATLTQVAMDCGFSSLSVFTQSFTRHFGIPAVLWRERRQIHPPLPDFPRQVAETRHELSDVKEEKMPALHTAYTTCPNGQDLQQIGAAWTRLFEWADASNLRNEDTIYLGIPYDDPLITPRVQCRYAACITVPDDTEAEEGVTLFDIPALTYAVLPYSGNAAGISQSYFWLYREWLPDSGYVPADSFPLNRYYNTPGPGSDGLFELDICLPVRKK